MKLKFFKKNLEWHGTRFSSDVFVILLAPGRCSGRLPHPQRVQGEGKSVRNARCHNHYCHTIDEQNHPVSTSSYGDVQYPVY